MHDVTPATTIGDIVAHDFRTSSVFARHGIDFCCGGRRSLDEACREQGMDTEAVIRELTALSPSPEVDAGSWPLDLLIHKIVSRHHAYIRRQVPALRALTQKVAEVHGARRPATRTVASLFADTAADLERHMEKEERILFPYIRALVHANEHGGPRPANPFGSVRNPIRMMEAEHSAAGSDMRAIRALTGDYEPPPDACITWRACYAALAEFERDLHQHVHLENNVLFPAAVRLEEEMS
jgi:regulator of cell morphogenesis and NO signaling